MKIIKILPLLALVALPVAAEAGSRDRGCAIKEQKLERELEYARAYHNRHRVAGLERALADVRARCSGWGLDQRYDKKISDKESKVREREFELREAKAKGDPKKIYQKTRKLEEAREELRRVRETGRY